MGFLNVGEVGGWFILAQIFGVVCICFEFWSYQVKEKAKYFKITGIGSFFWMMMFISVGIATGMSTQASLVVASSYSTIRNLIFWRVFSKNTPQAKEFGINFLLVMIGVALVAGTWTVVAAPREVTWLHALGMLTSIAFVIGQYLPGVHYVRIAVVLYAAVVFTTQTPVNILDGAFRWNIMGMAIESSKIISVIVFYIRFAKEPAMPQLRFEKP